MSNIKDSGIEWIGKIPINWEVSKIKFYCDSIYAGGTPSTTNLEYWDGDINWLPSGVCRNNIIASAPKKITQLGFENSSTKLIPANTAIIAMTGATCGNTGFVTIETCANQSVTAFIANKFSDSKFLWYLLMAAKENLLTFKSGGAQGGVNVDNCKNIVVPYVDLLSQQKIVKFLDEKWSQINKLISNQEQQIENLKSYKQSLITETVTKGLNSNFIMKDSGIKWIGAIPAQWDIVRIKNIAWLKGRIGWDGLKSTEYLEEGPYLITGTDFINGSINWSTCLHISRERYDEDELLHIKENDLLITKDGTIGKLAIVKNCPKEVSLNSGVMIIRNVGKFKIDNKYLFYILQSNQFLLWYELSQNGNSTIRHLYQGQFYNFKFTYPKFNEQIDISRFLDKKCSTIDKLIEIKQSKIEKLKDYKKSLIYEYVTGKKEVI